MKYNPQKIEKYWQSYWEEHHTYRAHDHSEKPKYYQLETFPYPSAAGLHVGHPKGYIAEDIHARYMRMKGYEVMYTMGWDAFGLPTENYAIKIGKAPADVARANIKNFKKQVQMFGLSYDWDREINTSSPEYYRWTQWLFIQLFKKGLAYQKLSKVNWCPNDQTVLANEQVVDGKCERCGHEVTQKEMKQWFFKISEYTEQLLQDVDGLDWPAATIKRQKDWIGKSEGARLRFDLRVPGQPDHHFVEVFTTRPDTLFGATFLVVSPELAQKWIDIGWQASGAVRTYISQSLSRKELDRLENAGEKTGVDAGIVAINPATKEEIPVWVADYVLGGYGTGAIMAVPAHDERDRLFAKNHGLPVRVVIIEKITEISENTITGYKGETLQNYLRDPRNVETAEKQALVWLEKHGAIPWSGFLINSNEFNNLDSETAKWKITEFVGGKKETNYKLRDWSVSRQRYWGVPIPIIYCDACGAVPVPDEDLPVKLPRLDDYRPKGVPPLASSEKFINVKCPTCGAKAQRDAETLDTFVDSSWYYLRYTDPHNEQAFADKEKMASWMPVKLYVIGAEHTVLHLLYSRFITKFLRDEGYLHFDEPFLKLRHVGLIQGSDGQKMSKSRGNVVNPDEVVGEYGADAVRLYEMFMGPFEDGQPWDTKGVVGTTRFLNRLWNFVQRYDAESKPNPEVQRVLNRYVKEISKDIEQFSFNTGVSNFMKLLNDIESHTLSRAEYETLLKLVAPYAPHIAEELWQRVLKNEGSIHHASWPVYEEALVGEEMLTIAVQVNGKVRDTISIRKDMSEAEVRELALASDAVKKNIEGKSIKKMVYVPGRIVSIVV